ncbi:MAG: LacI family DNA-binding transcriptional regulator [Anaerolineae bacterium]|jgi:LacI family transcriptional regulator
MTAEKLTIRQIAKLAGVSRSTVSRVLNDHPNVSPETRERVLHVVAETGFRPDPIARSLSSRRADIIGLVVPLSIQSLFEDPFFPRLMQGISQGCNRHDYTLTLFLLHTLEEEEKLYPRISRRQFLDGVIVTATRSGDPFIPKLLANRIPFVLHGRHEDPRVSFVEVDNVTGAHTAVTHLVRQGRRRIALITGPRGSLAAEDRERGYLNALRERRVRTDDALIIHGDFTETSGYEAMQRLLAHEPDAVFVASDSMALGAMRALREVQKRVPDEVAIVGFDDMPQAATADPPLTTIRQPIQRAGVLAVEMLIDILKNGAEPARRIILPIELVIRASCGSRLAG